MPQKSTVYAKAAIRKTRTADFAPASHDAELGGVMVFENGTTAGLADLAWTDQARSIAASGNELIDLNGVLTDDLGAAVNFARVLMIMIKASPANVNDLLMGGTGATFLGPLGAAAHTLAVRPGQTLILGGPDGTGWPVTAGSADLLRLANGGAGTAVVFDIAIIGRSV